MSHAIPDLDGVKERERLLLLSSDLEVMENEHQEREDSIQRVLNEIGSYLEKADETLEELEQDQDNLLSAAILRGCGDLANAVAHVAEELEEQSDDERRALALAFQEDAQLHLQQIQDSDDSTMSYEQKQQQQQQLVELSNISENDVIRAMEAAASFLRDVEASLLAIHEDAAEELADVGLTVARLFLASLQSIHAQITPTSILDQTRAKSRQPQMEIEFIDDNSFESDVKTTFRNYTEQQPSTSDVREDKQKKRKDRVRVLWPPIGPHVLKSLAWLKAEAIKRPILTVALGMVFWPAAVASAFVGAPLVVADGFLQDFYGHFQEAPLIVGVERGAAHLYQTARLALVSGKLVGHQTVFVIQRQVKRRGGVAEIVHQCVDWGVERITHPIETVQMTWGGLVWGVDQIQRAVQEFQDQERQVNVQAMQI
mmetsp:Transcript_11073/g.30583  ORF Transcript_11073/g.30583 Transcript_11073/m.30583 type:complete len:428 (-) Transcript_11073:1134-2417(-)